MQFTLRFLYNCVSNDTQKQKNLIIKFSKQIMRYFYSEILKMQLEPLFQDHRIFCVIKGLYS